MCSGDRDKMGVSMKRGRETGIIRRDDRARGDISVFPHFPLYHRKDIFPLTSFQVLVLSLCIATHKGSARTRPMLQAATDKPALITATSEQPVCEQMFLSVSM